MPRCQVCGREVNFASVAYVKGSVFVCRECFPGFYVRICKMTQRRLRGESPIACSFCSFKRVCDAYVSRTVKALS